MDQGRTSFMDDREGANYMTERSKAGLPSSSAKRLARGLGWFSFGLGLAELLAPRAVANIASAPV